MTSVLSRAGALALATDPFPHLLIDDALEPQIYASLAEQFPSIDIVNRRGRPVKNNHLYLLSAQDVMEDVRIAQAWRDFFRYHVSVQFWRDALPLIKSQLLTINPGLETLAGRPLEEFRVAVREKDAEFEQEISLDCQFGMNSPVIRRSSVRSPHLDHPSKLFNALLYCRAPDDDTPGGELILYRRTGPLAYSDGSSILPTRVVAAKRIAYRANRLVLFLNSPWSVHGVAPRPQTPHVRRYVNFLCEFRQPLFDVERASALTRYLETARAAMQRVTANRAPLEEVV
jgi:hypothetical protein